MNYYGHSLVRALRDVYPHLSFDPSCFNKPSMHGRGAGERCAGEVRRRGVQEQSHGLCMAVGVYSTCSHMNGRKLLAT